MTGFPTLYKKTNTGAIQYWSISVKQKLNSGNGGWLVVTEFGQKDTTNPQFTSDLITQGKNIGKKNETSPKEQAYLEAKYKWEKQKKKGYCEEISAASAGEVDNLIKGGILPMLAHPYSKQGHKIKFPCYSQPKLDGHRCIAIVKSGKCELWSRTRKLITGVPHIAKQLAEIFSTGIFTFDGELYNHKYKDNFEKLTHYITQDNPIDGHEEVEYHIYDIVSSFPYETRFQLLKGLNKNHSQQYITKSSLLVETQWIEDDESIKHWFDYYIRQGYEGMMLRNKDGLYEYKRSYNLQKVKEFDDAEFKVIGINEGKGKLSGHVGSFICQMDSGETFDVKLKGELDNLKRYFDDENLWKNKYLTVQFQGFTGKNKVPRFPIALRFREDL